MKHLRLLLSLRLGINFSRRRRIIICVGQWLAFAHIENHFFLITLLGPSLFIAFLSFHPELIPTPLLINLAAQRQNIPFQLL
ncbi:spore germination protein [Bacillus megaterium]|nr:spore germination protein [Priestia megaterium]